MLATLNQHYRGHSNWKCEYADCRDAGDSIGTWTYSNASEKMSLLTHILAEYYNAIDDIEEATPESHIQRALPHIAVLYHKLALLHPFQDGNSRTRNTVLQTELVRQ